MSLLAARLGHERADAVIRIAGGQRLSVPQFLERAGSGWRLEELFGRELAVLLVLHFGGSSIYVPTGAGKSRGKDRLRAVVSLTASGWSANKIARELGCSDRTVYACRAKAKARGIK